MKEFKEYIAKYQDKANTREYEFAITEKSKTLNADNLDKYLSGIHDTNEDTFIRFSCFFLVYTYYRKNNLLSDLDKIVDENYSLFKSQFLFPFLYIMKEAKLSTINQLDRLLSEGEKHLEMYKDYIGYLNLYTEICAKYYEVNLDLRGEVSEEEQENPTDEIQKKMVGNARLKKALEAIETCCKEQSDYHKFYVNKGRIYALLGDYDNAEKFILEGISKVNNDSYHDKTVSSYEGAYNNVMNIISYDKAQKTIKLCEKKQDLLDKSVKGIQIDNLKNLSILSTVIAFLLGGVEAFANITDYFVIGKVMLMYSGLFLCLIGFISLLATVSIFKFKQKLLPNLLAMLLIVIGILIFALTIIIR